MKRFSRACFVRCAMTKDTSDDSDQDFQARPSVRLVSAMLKSTKEHWKQRAEEEYNAATNEQSKMEQERMNQYDWNRRYREGQWLLKGAKKVEDSALTGLIDQKKERDKRGRYIKEEDEKKKKKAEEETEGLNVVTAQKAKTDYLRRIRNYMIPKKEKKKKGRFRNARFVIKEGIAKLFVDRDVKNERDRFIQTNSHRIRLLQNIRLDLHKPKLPAHHESTEFMADAEPPMTAEVAAEIGEKNLRTYIIPPRERIVEKLRSVEEVKNEEIERRLHRVPGRFHQFLGLHRIFPLRFAPQTHDVLYSEHAIVENYPEDKLLPDYEAIERKKQEELRLRQWESNPIKKIKKSKLDMARKQFHFQNNAVLPITADVPEGTQHARINTQFDWKTRQIQERNSVYSQPHGSVQFGAQNSVFDGSSSARDDSTTDTSVKYYLDGDQSVSLLPAMTSGQTVAASLSSYGDMATELCYSDEFASKDALRSNFFSQGSTGSNCLVRVRMERHRKLKHLVGKHVKGLSLESIRTQQKRRDIQQIKKFTQMHPQST